jgi:tetratricopeptide (TPR) repeat protein
MTSILASPDPLTGRQLGTFVIGPLLGAGGMGEVYHARDTKLDRDVALKILPADVAQHPEGLSRFEREARALAALNHPNIAVIYGTEESNGIHALVLELVEGPTLADRLAGGPLPAAEALGIAREIADALGAAHNKGIVHRDLKPANIKITPEGRVKVLDFGLAKMTAGDPSPDITHTPTITVDATRAGTIVGTAAYMSPEQARGTVVDKRTDIWAFGCVCYEMLTGRRAFARDTMTDTLAAIIEREPSWDALPSTTPPDIRRLLQRCLEKEPDRRFHDVVDVRRALEDAGPTHTAVASVRIGWLSAAGVALLVIGAGVAAAWLLPRKAQALTDKDSIVLADFTNTTGDAVFDGTLRQGLAIQLQQSPFLSLIPDQRIQQTLALMGQPPGTRLTPKLASEVCERTAAAAVLEGSIASLGSQYVVGLRAKNCRTGDLLDEEQAQATRKEDVLASLSQIASTFRTRVGESLATVEKHSTPLADATTSSLDALKAYSTALTIASTTGPAEALPFLKRAIDIDPNFAAAHARLGFLYGNLNEATQSAEGIRKAWQLRDRASDPERFFISVSYDMQVTGNMERAEQTCDVWAETFPREMDAHGFLAGAILPVLGKYDKALQESRKLLDINPNLNFGYNLLGYSYAGLERLEEAERAMQQAAERKLEMPDFLVQRYQVAFVRGHESAMKQAVADARGKAGAEDWLADQEAAALAYRGRVKEAHRLATHASDLSRQASQLDRAAAWDAGQATWDALFGNGAAARTGALAVLKRSRTRDVAFGAAFALALSGESRESRALVDGLEKRLPEDTAVRFSYAPTVRALLALNEGQPARAVERLQMAAPFELGAPPSAFQGTFGTFYPIYVRGLAYLASRQGVQAAHEFQKILDHPGIVFNDPVGAAARVQRARALSLTGNTAEAKTGYEDFFKLWKDADSDIPVLQQAKAEYARLR